MSTAMKKFLIKLLGGFTQSEINDVRLKEVANSLNDIEKLKRLSFREGDTVYINDEKFQFGVPYYLLEAYNGGYHWYVSQRKDDNQRSVSNGVGYLNISHERPMACPTCNQLIKLLTQ